jgi:hypothetical protein
MHKNGKSEGNIEGLLKLRDAALPLGISFPTIKQWILQEEDSKQSDCGRTSSYPAERSGQIAFQNPWLDRATTQRRNPAREWS